MITNQQLCTDLYRREEQGDPLSEHCGHHWPGGLEVLVPNLPNTDRPHKPRSRVSVSLIEDERSRLLRGMRNGFLLVSPFWIGLIYWLVR